MHLCGACVAGYFCLVPVWRVISGSYSYKSMHFTHNCIESVVYVCCIHVVDDWLKSILLQIRCVWTLPWSVWLECIFLNSFLLISFNIIYFMTLFLVLWVWTNLDKKIDPYTNILGTKEEMVYALKFLLEVHTGEQIGFIIEL